MSEHPTTPSPRPRPPEQSREETRAELAATVDALTRKLDVTARAKSGAHDAYQALADRHGARLIVFGGTAAAVLALVLLRKLVTR
jgi:hypothetical protein